MSEFPLNIEEKEDYPEKLISLEGTDSKYWESAEEKNKKVRALQEVYDKINITNDKIKTSEVIFSVADEAAMTAKYNSEVAAGRTPVDGKEQIFRKDLNQFWKWDSTETSKGKFSRENFNKAVDGQKLEGSNDYHKGNQTLVQVKEELIATDKNDADTSKAVALSVVKTIDDKVNELEADIDSEESARISADNQIASNLTDGSTINAATWKSELDIDQVDNTSDLDKPISTATQSALGDKLNIIDAEDADFDLNSATWRSKLDIDQVDNTSDLDKPISTATKSEIDANFADYENAVSADEDVWRTKLGIDQVDNTSDVDKPVSTATQAEIDSLQTDIDNFTVNSDDLDRGSITPILTSFFDFSDQLFNINSSENAIGFYINTLNGQLLSNANYSTSHFIPVEPNTDYKRRYAHNIAYYTRKKEFISGDSGNTSITTPADCYFLRSTSPASTIDRQIINLGTTLIDFEAFYERLKIINSPVKTDISIPVLNYTLSSKQTTINFIPLLKRYLPNDYFVRLEGSSNWINYRNLARVETPVNENGLSLNLYDVDFNIVKEKVVNVVVGDVAIDNGNININPIGDSFTYNGRYIYRLTTMLPNITTVGMRKSYDPPTDILAEGRGGWTLANYFEDYKGSSSMSFSPFMHPIDPYTYYGSTQFWKLVSLGSATGYNVDNFEDKASEIGFNSSDGYLTTPTTNDVMWVNDNSRFEVYNGSAWVEIDEVTLDFSFNYEKYRSTWNIANPNIVSILLGLNDFRELENTSEIDDQWGTWMARMEEMIASISSDSPNAKIMVCIPSSAVGSMDNAGGFFTAKQNAMMWHARTKMIEEFEGRNGENIYLVDTGAAIDSEYAFEFSTEKPYSDYSGSSPYDEYSRKITENSPHPSFHGYNAMSIPLAGCIQSVRGLL